MFQCNEMLSKLKFVKGRKNTSWLRFKNAREPRNVARRPCSRRGGEKAARAKRRKRYLRGPGRGLEPAS